MQDIYMWRLIFCMTISLTGPLVFTSTLMCLGWRGSFLVLDQLQSTDKFWFGELQCWGSSSGCLVSLVDPGSQHRCQPTFSTVPHQPPKDVHAKSLQLHPTLQPHGLQPTRLLCPWDFRGKNTGMGCHALLQVIFLSQGLNLDLLCLLHLQADSLPLAPPAKSSQGLLASEWDLQGLQI